MIDFGVVSIEWGTLLFQLMTFLILLGLPVGLIVYLITRSNRKKKTMAELERRIEQLEQEVKQNKKKESQ
ncbi:UNVERIFIED_CONTAM: large-conductance mechanosensitive channel [Brevibacillus sp. OAP136]